MQPPRTQYADSGGVSIAYQVVGDGDAGVDIVVVPGFVSNVETMWAEPLFYRLVRNFSRFARVVLFDKRGTGCSDPVPAPPTLEERIDDIRAVIDAVGVDRAVLNGISEGGPMSMLFAATYPERTRALVLYGTFATVESFRDRYNEFSAFVDHWGEGLTAEHFIPTLAHDPMQRRMWSVWERTGASPGMARKLTDSILTIDVRPILPTIGSPTIVIHRTGDGAIPVAAGRYVAEHIPGARFVELPGNDHVPYQPDVADELVGVVEEFVLGARHAVEPTRALATVLFTDLVGSTEHAAAVGDRQWRAQIEDHDELIRSVLGRYQGRAIKTLGDGVLATFDGPARAVQCACELTDRVAAAGLQMRAGIHTGEVEIVGDDIAGMAVHLAARVSAKAGPGEVLVTTTVRDLVMGSTLEFTDRGRHALKGVPGEWQLLAVDRQPSTTGSSEPLPTTTRASSFTGRTMDAMAVRTPRLARAGAMLSRRVAAARR